MVNFPSHSEVLFVAGFGPITQDTLVSRDFYLDTLGLPLNAMEGNSDYLTCEDKQIGGVNHFALWPLSQAAQLCFGVEIWSADHAVPQSWIEFEVANITKVTQDFVNKDYTVLISERQEPWGQIVTRLLSPEGMLVGLTITPWLR